MKYQSELIKELVDKRGHEKSSIHYQSECVETWIEENKGAYPKLNDYTGEWLNYINLSPVGEFPYEVVTTDSTTTINNVVPLSYKSAILKGNTLVNLVVNSSVEKIAGQSSLTEAIYDYIYQLENNKEYTVKFEISNFNATQPMTCSFDNGWNNIDSITVDKNGVYKTKFTTKGQNSTQIWFYWTNYTWEDGYSATVKNIVILEGDHTQEDIPYFEGMQSVKIPVLKASGKNLFDEKNTQLYSEESEKIIVTQDISQGVTKIQTIKLEKGDYTLSLKNTVYDGTTTIEFGLYDFDKSKWKFNCSLSANTQNHVTFSVPESGSYDFVLFKHGTGVINKYETNIQIEKGTQTTSYEPFKSNILPVLTTTGKNIFSPSKMTINDGTLYGYYKYKDDESVTYTLSISDKDTSVDISGIYLGVTKTGVDSNGGYNWLIGDGSLNANGTKVVTNFNFISIFPNNTEMLNKITERFNIQLEQGSNATPYEPYKSNILTVNEEVELRGIGDVKDELNVATGELTQRIGEIVLDGSEDGWTMSNTMIEEGFVRFYGNPIGGMKTNSYLICDKLPQSIKTYGNGDVFECVAGRNNNTRINVKLKLETLGLVDNTISNNSIAIFKSWLKNNNLKIKFELESESIKTVDLSITNQDGESLNQIKPIEGTMVITVTSDAINPTVMLEVPVEAITQNLASFIEE